MISIELKGGFGNQMFQIYTLLAYAMEHGYSFQIPKIGVTSGPTGHRRDCYWDSIFKGLSPFLKSGLGFMVSYREPSFHYTKIPKIPDNTSLSGYFQSYKYFEEYSNTIARLLNIEEIKRGIPQISDDVSTISLHFRIGDYAQLKDHHPVISLEYYKKALDYILERDCTPFKVLYYYEKADEEKVTELINQLKTHMLSTKHQITFKPVDHGLKDWQQVLQMSQCQHNIIANSSFSWWGAYLNNNPNKIVCYPSTWFGHMLKHDTKDLCPLDWICI